MSCLLEGRVAIVTGAGRGLGREHARLLAALGASVVVNDIVTDDGSRSAAEQVVAEIEAAGGHAVANHDSVSDWSGSQRIVETAVEAFGDLHVLVNNAGFVRDRTIVNMSEADWDDVVAVHLKGTFCPTRHAAAYWRQRAKETAAPASAAVVCTSSTSGLLNHVGQANYGAAKAGVAGFAQVAAKELARYGVRVNTIAPNARTRLTEAAPGLGDMMQAPDDPAAFDVFDPANIAPLVAYLVSPACDLTGTVWVAMGSRIALLQGWDLVETLSTDGRWTIEALSAAVPALVAGRDLEERLPSEGIAMAALARSLLAGTPLIDASPGAVSGTGGG